MGLFAKFKEAWLKPMSFDSLNEGFYDDLEEALILADVGMDTAVDAVAQLKKRAYAKLLTHEEDVKNALRDILAEKLSVGDPALDLSTRPSVALIIGVNGVGKTTSIGKLAHRLKNEGKKVLLCAGDTFRAAAADQLEIWAERAGVDIVRQNEGADPGAVLFDSLAAAKARNTDVVLCDTAGRLHNKDNLMKELAKLRKIIDREAPNAAKETLLVLDATTGQNGLIQARQFKETAGLTGIILTKLDGDTRGGAALSARQVTGKPIKFVGVGEKLDDLELFHPERMASRILGMGDVLTLIEKAQETQDLKKAEETARRMMENKFDLNDMLDQFAQMKKMGGAAGMLSMLPGGNQIDPDQIDESIFTRMEAIIQSMTPAERAKPSIIDPKRKRRIAAGSGTKVEDVNRLLKQFEQMSKLLKQIKKSPRAFGRRFGLGRRR